MFKGRSYMITNEKTIEKSIDVINTIDTSSYYYVPKKTAEKSSMYYLVKRAFDIVVSMIGIVVSLPILIVVSILIKLEDNGNVLYKHQRVGKDGKPLYMYKFRSMKKLDKPLEEILTPEQLYQYRTEFKIDNDPRITKIGNVIRKTSIDELPQLFNILLGDMSLVGPRPITKEEVELYGKDKSLLLSVKPGLTGYWQAYGRNNVTYESGERQKMELYYCNNQSLVFDVKILFKTVVSVIKKDGAQ